MGKPVRKFGPMVASVGRLIDSSLLRTADDGPRFPPPVPDGCENSLGRSRLERDVRRREFVRDMEHVRPGFASSSSAKDAPVVIGCKWMPDWRDINEVGV